MENERELKRWVFLQVTFVNYLLYMSAGIAIRRATIEDVSALHRICCDAYSRNFHHHWEGNGLEQYLNKVFGIDTLAAEIIDVNVRYFIACHDYEPAGFMKLNLYSNLPGRNMATGIEVDKIYVLPELKGKRIGKALLNTAFTIAHDLRKEIFWLSVIDTNLEAITFYEKAGFIFHSKTRLDYPLFREELKGMCRMYLELSIPGTLPGTLQ
jgi:diamine N-acetyltransferase